MVNNLSDNGLQLVRDSEGYMPRAYQDTGGVWTIGYGSTRFLGREVRKGDVCTNEQAVTQLKLDIASACESVGRLVKVPLTQNQFDALVDFVYNLGEGQFIKSTLLKKLNLKDYVGASDEFKKWVFDNGKIQPGLVSRRHRETDLFSH
jgi:lysozyme